MFQDAILISAALALTKNALTRNTSRTDAVRYLTSLSLTWTGIAILERRSRWRHSRNGLARLYHGGRGTLK